MQRGQRTSRPDNKEDGRMDGLVRDEDDDAVQCLSVS